jgi:hypothetical protein
MPLSLAVILVREKLYCKVHARADEADPNAPDSNALAALIATAVPLYECADDPAVPPRIMSIDPSKGRFRNDGRELHFPDGTPAKRRLAVQADELAAMIATFTRTRREASS